MRRALAVACVLWPCAAIASPIHVITLIDIVPDRTATALPIIAARAAAVQHEAGVGEVRLLQETGRPNHFILTETLRDQAAFDAQAESAPERAYRAALFPYLGSPYDEILTREITSSASSG